jgi:integrase
MVPGSRKSQRQSEGTAFRRLHPLVIEKIAIGGTRIPSWRAARAQRRAAAVCHTTVRVKNAACAGRRRLTRTKSEKSMRRPWFRDATWARGEAGAPIAREEKALFLSRQSGRRIAVRTVGQIVARAAKRSGVSTPVTPHTFRHSMATHMLRNRADLRHIQAILGHSQITSTEIYTHVSLEDLKEVVRRAHPHGRKGGRSVVP